MQSRVIDGLQKTMQHIIKKVGSLTEVVDRLDGVDVPDDSSSSSIENLPIVKKSENSKSRRSGLKVRFAIITYCKLRISWLFRRISIWKKWLRGLFHQSSKWEAGRCPMWPWRGIIFDTFRSVYYLLYNFYSNFHVDTDAFELGIN